MINYTKADTGDWHAAVYSADADTVISIADILEVQETAFIGEVGYALLDGGLNEYKPYLYVTGFNEKAFEMLSVHLKSGRLPENENEVLVPYHLFTNGGVEYRIGDTIGLNVGCRVSEDGTDLGQKDQYMRTTASERLVITGTREYKVVGIGERPSMLGRYFAPGYSYYYS